MEWIRRSLCKIKKRSAKPGRGDKSAGQKQSCINGAKDSRERSSSIQYNSSDSHNRFSEEEKIAEDFFKGLSMRLKKDNKIRSSEGTRTGLKPEMSKVNKIQRKSFRSKVVHPKKVKTKSTTTWIDRLLNKNNNNEESFREYLKTSEGEFKEPVHRIYASQFLHCEHFNLVGEDKNLGPLILSIRYSNEAADSDKNGDFLKQASMLLRLPTGTAHHHLNQFQLSQLSSQSPLSLAKLSFPSLSVCRLMPVLCPEAWLLIAEYDRTSERESKDLNEDQEEEISSRTKQLKKLQEKLTTSTCKFLEFSNWDFDAYDKIVSKTKPNLVPKYLSFTKPNTPKSPNEIKSPKATSLTKSLLHVENGQTPSTSSNPSLSRIPGGLALGMKKIFDKASSKSEKSSAKLCSASRPSPLLTIKPDGDCHRSSLATLEPAVPSNPLADLTEQLLMLSTDNSLDECQDSELGFAADRNKLVEMEFNIIKLNLEKEQLMEKNSALEKEKEELMENESRLARELATANIIIESLEDRVQR